MKDLYLISTETLQYPAILDRSEHNKESYRRGCIIKTGEANDAEIRVETLDGTFVYEKPKILHVWKNSPLSDKDVHKEYEKRGRPKYREDRDREFFEWESIEQAIRETNDILFGTKHLKTYDMRQEQKDIIEGVCNLFDKNSKVILNRKIRRALINAKMRAGKCHISYQIIKKMNFKRILVLTYKPNGVKESWEDDIDHIDFKNFTFNKSIDMNNVKFEDSDKTQIIFASFQDAIGDDGNKEKWKNLFDQNIDLIIKDEDHYGYETEKSSNFLNKLNYKYELSLSGTPFKAILDGKYDKEEVFTWTYLQEQLRRNEEKNNGWKTEIYRALPEFEIYICKYTSDLIKEFSKYYTQEEKPTNFKLFSQEKLVYQFLTWVKLDPNMNKLITAHMFWFLPQIINCDTIEKVLSTHPLWKDYSVVNASGDNIKDIEDTKNRIYTKKPNSITLSCGRWNTGSTVKEWSSIWMLDDGYSAENWFQTGMRCGTPWIDKNNSFIKEKVHIVDFNSDRMLKCYVEYSTVISKYTGYESSEFSKEMLNCMPIFSVDGASTQKINNEDIFIKFNELLTDWFGSLASLDKQKLDDDIKEIIDNINGNIINEQNLTLNKESQGKGKNASKLKTKEGKSGQIEKEIDWIIKGRLITNRFKNFLYVVDKITNVDDIDSYKEEFETVIGINTKNFKILLNKGFIVKDKINEGIELFNINNNFLYN